MLEHGNSKSCLVGIPLGEHKALQSKNRQLLTLSVLPL